MNNLKKRGLNRGLDALLSPSLHEKRVLPETSLTTKSPFQWIALSKLERGKYQPRKDMHPESLEELAQSIRVQGIIQPIVVRETDKERYEIIAGERRWRAAQLVGLETVPVLIKEISDESAMAMALIENIQREDLNPLEEAEALKRLLQEFRMTHQAIAEAVGKSRTSITNTLRLLQLNTEVKILLAHGDLEMGHARALLSLEEDKQLETAKLIANKALSVRETEKLVQKISAGKSIKKPSPKPDPNINALQRELSEILNTKVQIQHSANNKGKIIIHYHNLDALDGILKRIKK